MLRLVALLEAGQVLGHPFVTAELALGTPRQRPVVIDALQGLPQAAVATQVELLLLIEREGLAGVGIGIGHVDAHLIAATRLMGDARSWTRDKRQEAVVQRMKLANAYHPQFLHETTVIPGQAVGLNPESISSGADE